MNATMEIKTVSDELMAVRGTINKLPVRCAGCGYDDHETLILQDRFAIDQPPGPRRLMPNDGLEVVGDSDDGEIPRGQCPVCSTMWLPHGVTTLGQEQRHG